MLKRLAIGSVLVALCGLASVRQAKADNIDTFTFTTTSNDVYSWQILPSPTDVTVDTTNGFFAVSAPYTLNGITPTGTLASPATLNFYLGGAFGGGFQLSGGIMPTIILNTAGPQLFAGTLASPTFTLIPVDDAVTLDIFGTTTLAGTLSVVSTPIPVVGTPEPSSLLLTGLGLIALLGLAWKKQIFAPFRHMQAGSEA
jgi:hypothetical protein